MWYVRNRRWTKAIRKVRRKCEYNLPTYTIKRQKILALKMMPTHWHALKIVLLPGCTKVCSESFWWKGKEVISDMIIRSHSRYLGSGEISSVSKGHAYLALYHIRRSRITCSYENGCWDWETGHEFQSYHLLGV